MIGITLAAILAQPRHATADDAQLWTELGVAWEAAETIEVSFDQGIRFDQDMSRLNAIIPELGVRYRPVKWFRAGVAYRLEYERNSSDELVVRHRFQADGRVRRDLGDLRLSYELKLQEAYRPSSNDQLRFTVRNEVSALYRAWRPWAIAGSVELHHDVDQGDAIHLDKVWLTIGGSHSKKRNEWLVFYRIELPQYDTTAPMLHIFGVAFHHELGVTGRTSPKPRPPSV